MHVVRHTARRRKPRGGKRVYPGPSRLKVLAMEPLHIREVFAKPRGYLTYSTGKALGINGILWLDERIFHISC